MERHDMELVSAAVWLPSFIQTYLHQKKMKTTRGKAGGGETMITTLCLKNKTETKRKAQTNTISRSWSYINWKVKAQKVNSLNGVWLNWSGPLNGFHSIISNGPTDGAAEWRSEVEALEERRCHSLCSWCHSLCSWSKPTNLDQHVE